MLSFAVDPEKVAAGLAEEQNLWRLMGLDLPTLRERAHAGAIASKPLLDDVKTLCLFIGYQRSGHSLVGSLLDAHPRMAIAHELDALFYLKAPDSIRARSSISCSRSRVSRARSGGAGAGIPTRCPGNGRAATRNSM